LESFEKTLKKEKGSRQGESGTEKSNGIPDVKHNCYGTSSMPIA